MSSKEKIIVTLWENFINIKVKVEADLEENKGVTMIISGLKNTKNLIKRDLIEIDSIEMKKNTINTDRNFK